MSDRRIPAIIGNNTAMKDYIVNALGGVTLIAGGAVATRDLIAARRFAPILVAADGGADHVLKRGMIPDAVIGDFDSLSQSAQDRIPKDRLHRIAEQETTDFDKALRSIRAGFVIGLGCLGGRVDHSLAGLNALVRLAAPCVLPVSYTHLRAHETM
jgi:thiamine pyrophosphokinase